MVAGEMEDQFPQFICNRIRCMGNNGVGFNRDGIIFRILTEKFKTSLKSALCYSGVESTRFDKIVIIDPSPVFLR